jgi:hypothetical protein
VNETAPHDGTTYDIAVTGMTVPGAVTVQVPPSVAQDLAGNPNNGSSTATVTYDNAAPTVTLVKASTQANPTNGSHIHFTATFNKPVTGFGASGVDLSASTAGGPLEATVTETDPNDGTTYDVAVSGMTGSGDVIAQVLADAAQDGLGNHNIASSPATVKYDVDAPTVGVAKASGQADPTSGSTINFTATFSEAVTGFDNSGVAFTGSTTGGTPSAVVTETLPNDGTTYNIAVSGMDHTGTVKVTIPDGAATDLAGNSSQANSTGATVAYDITPPDVTIVKASGQDDPTTAHTVHFTATFTKSVTGFGNVAADVTLTGSAGATTATVTGNGTTYDIAVTGMIGSGDIVAEIPAGAATDAAGNGNTASPTSASITCRYFGARGTSTSGSMDATGTTFSFAHTVGTGNARLLLVGLSWNCGTTDRTATVTFTPSGGSAVPMTQVINQLGYNTTNPRHSAIYKLLDPPSGAGTVTVTFSGTVTNGAVGGAADFAGVDQTNPLGTAVGAPATTTTGTAITVPLTGLNGNELVFDNVFVGSGAANQGLTPASGQSQQWMVNTYGTGSGGTSNAVCGGASTRKATSNSATMSWTAGTGAYWAIAAVPINPSADYTAPTVDVAKAGGQADPTGTGPIHFTATFSEAVEGFDESDVAFSGGAGATTTAVTDSGDHKTYDIAVSGMTTVGDVTVAIPAAAAQDLAGNASLASSGSATVSYDNVVPTVTITKKSGQDDPTNNGPIDFTVVFSKSVSDFTGSDIDLTASTTGGTLVADVTEVGALNGKTYTVSVSGMGTSGAVTASIPAGAAHDLAGNGNLASDDATVAYDVDAPTVTIDKQVGQADPAKTGPIHFTVTFNEPVSAFTSGDVHLDGTSSGGSATIAPLGSDNTTWTVSVSGMSDGTVIASIPAGAAKDAAGNSSTASPASATVTYDATAPAVTITKKSGQGSLTNTSPIDFTVTFSEPVIGFASGDVNLDGTSTGGSATITPVGSDNTTWTVSVSGMTDGTVIASIPAGAAKDAAGNSSTASPASATVTYDATAPAVTITKKSGQGDPTKTSPIDFTVLFSEPVTGFVADDVTLSGPGSPSAVITGSGTTYNVAVSGMSDGTVTASIPAGAAKDAAGNSSTASPASATVTYDATAPTVTVNKKSGQGDPTKTSPIDFTVIFSEPVSGFTADDLSFTGSTTGSPLAGVLTPVGSESTTWTVAVSGMSHNGDVTLTIPSGAATDAAGNGSAASTSSDNTVAYNPTVTLAVTTGWNLVAAAPGTVFSGSLWEWIGGGFQSVNDPQAWSGYWYKSTQDANVDMYTVSGPKTYDLADGWNLIGNSMATPATVTVPQGSGLVVWAWVVVAGNGSFQSVTTLQPGQGAWVKGTAGQQVTLTPAS